MLAYGLPNSYLIGSATRSAPSALRRSANVRHLPATHTTDYLYPSRPPWGYGRPTSSVSLRIVLRAPKSGRARPLRYATPASPCPSYLRAPTSAQFPCATRSAPPSLCRSCPRCRSISSPLRALSVSATASFICSKGSTIGGATLPPSRPTSASCPFQGLVAWLRANRGATPRLPFLPVPAPYGCGYWHSPPRWGRAVGAPVGRPPFLSASALSCGFVGRGFPAGAVAQRLPPCRRPRLPAT